MNTFGQLFRVSIFGESHGPGVGVLIDGCPPGIEIIPDEMMHQLNRRKSGARGTTPRKEHDEPEFISGIYNGFTTGAPVVIMTRNINIKSSDYEKFRNVPRPGHADMVSKNKYQGFADRRGGGHFSGRLTWGLVAAGVIARSIIKPADVKAALVEAGGRSDIDSAVEDALTAKDSIGGIIECRVNGLPAGLGEPFFYSAESAISQIVFSIPAIKGIEFGSGFRAARMKGSEHNDPIISRDGMTATNNAGGINGGITNGNELIFRIAVKPTSGISIAQETLDIEMNRMTKLEVEGRHDACIALRIPVIVESVTAISLADLALINNGIFGNRG
ncbi:MAG TPA: chorismate synthase [Bacteroidales bacterium]|nr:chorismate synthase [Bacteroidales bacterium]